jgi:hypothetical protein
MRNKADLQCIGGHMIAIKAPFVFETSAQNYSDLKLRACLLKFVSTYT